LDPLTHTLVGAALARTRIARGVPLAGIALVAGANLPDVDVLSHFAGADVSFGFRRGWTHGPLGLAVLPVLLTAVLLALEARLRRRRPDRPPSRPACLLGLAYLGCFTHPVLDWLNTYGIRFLMPFDSRWFYGDAVFIVDLWLWMLLGGAVSLGSRGRRAMLGWVVLALTATALVFVAAPIVPSGARIAWVTGLIVIVLARRARSVVSRPERAATVALVVGATYIATMLAASTVAERHVRSRLESESIGTVQDLMIGPAPANPLVWEVVVATDRVYRQGTLRFWPARLELDPTAIPRPEPSPLLDAVLAAPDLRGTIGWMRFPFWEVEETPEGYTVHLLDARYARPGDRGFGTARIRLDRTLRVLR
jgi:inner membrane protein